MLKLGDDEYFEDNFIFAEPEFLHMYDFKIIMGDRKTALRGPNELLLTQSAAKKYFGDEDPVGKTLNLNNFSDLKVVGVMAVLPANSHQNFDMIGSFETFKTYFNTPQ